MSKIIYREFLGNNQDKAIDGMKEVINTTCYQRSNLWLVAVDCQQWGSFHPQSNLVQLHEQEQTGDADWLNFAVIHHFGNSKTVLAVEPSHILNESPVVVQFPAVNCYVAISVVTHLEQPPSRLA